ncbi:pectin lyase-like protein [Terfezia boudieri ATCC MYA-4762]|uniref:Pectate lyase n=1 Tax=Terfezia boudieri ATCC MYA-4762 TaxID=1051890 RepID=A0A3N4M017_9PEZI|nr:pectin lyase-like protein [Terfezia boudieri ATCC MYA-4762]
MLLKFNILNHHHLLQISAFSITFTLLENALPEHHVWLACSLPRSEGVHCKGDCVLNNVWWLDVCEVSIDAATLKADSGTFYINGGGARSAADKVFQHNGFGTVSIKNFYVDTFDKLYRSYGNSSNNGKPRAVIIHNIYGGVLAGINANYEAKISNSCVPNDKDTSGEPPKLSSEPDGTYYVATNISGLRAKQGRGMGAFVYVGETFCASRYMSRKVGFKSSVHCWEREHVYDAVTHVTLDIYTKFLRTSGVNIRRGTRFSNVQSCIHTKRQVNATFMYLKEQ